MVKLMQSIHATLRRDDSTPSSAFAISDFVRGLNHLVQDGANIKAMGEFRAAGSHSTAESWAMFWAVFMRLLWPMLIDECNKRVEKSGMWAERRDRLKDSDMGDALEQVYCAITQGTQELPLWGSDGVMAKLMTAASAFMNGEHARESRALDIVEELFLPAATDLGDTELREYQDDVPLLLPMLVDVDGVVQEGVRVDQSTDVASMIRHSTPGDELYLSYVCGLHEDATEEELKELPVVRVGVRERHDQR